MEEVSKVDFVIHRLNLVSVYGKKSSSWEENIYQSLFNYNI